MGRVFGGTEIDDLRAPATATAMSVPERPLGDIKGTVASVALWPPTVVDARRTTSARA